MITACHNGLTDIPALFRYIRSEFGLGYAQFFGTAIYI